MQVVKQEILDAVDKRFAQGDSFRMRHRFKNDGSECTPVDKDPAMTVTRVSNGWIFHCHRCHVSGVISNNNLNPGQTRARIEALKKIPINKVTEKVDLPNDFEQLTDKDLASEIPWGAYHWLWQYNITEEDFLNFKIGWSKAYQRVIIPLYEWAKFGDEWSSKLVGWVGREVKYSSKEERVKAGIPKYLTRAKKGKRRFFMIMGEEGKVVICEDCVSAMKVNMSTGYTTVALLNTSVSTDLMRWLRGKTIYLWLDSDMLADSVKQVNRMRELGLDAKHVHTPKDPKAYNTVFIKDTIGRKKDGK